MPHSHPPRVTLCRCSTPQGESPARRRHTTTACRRCRRCRAARAVDPLPGPTGCCAAACWLVGALKTGRGNVNEVTEAPTAAAHTQLLACSARYVLSRLHPPAHHLHPTAPACRRLPCLSGRRRDGAHPHHPAGAGGKHLCVPAGDGGCGGAAARAATCTSRTPGGCVWRSPGAATLACLLRNATLITSSPTPSPSRSSQAEFSLHTPESAWRSGQGLRPYIKDAQRLLIAARESGSRRILQVRTPGVQLQGDSLSTSRCTLL